MLELTQISTLLNIFEKATGLLRNRSIKKKEFFDQIISPLQEDLEPICLQYSQFFRHCSDLIEGEHSPQTLLAEIKNKRDTMAFARINITSQAAALSSHARHSKNFQDEGGFDKAIGEYCTRIESYFYGHHSSVSRATHLMRQVEDFALDQSTKSYEIARVVQLLQFTCEDNWREITESYSRLRILAHS